MLHPKLIKFRPERIDPASPLLFRFDIACRPREDSTAATGNGRGKNERFTAAADSACPDLIKPILLYGASGGDVIIDGHLRAENAFLANIKEIPALLYPGTISASAAGRLALISFMESANGSGLEKLLAVYKSSRFALGLPGGAALPFCGIELGCIPADIHSLTPHLFGRNLSEAFLLKCFKVFTLGTDEIEFIHNLNIPAESIPVLLDLKRQERLWLLRNKVSLPLTFAETRKLSRLLSLARSRKKFDLKKFTGKLPKSAAAGSGSALIGALRREIFPELSGREQKVTEHIKKMRLPNAIKLKIPENLEGNAVSCYFTFSSSREFRRYINLLNWAGGDGKIKDLLNDLNPPCENSE